MLAEREKQAEEDKIAISNLGKALNSALANKVQELRRFRSEFFGRLRDVLEGQAMLKWSGTALLTSLKYCFTRPGQAKHWFRRPGTISTNSRGPYRNYRSDTRRYTLDITD